jgi:DNA-binding transcriptional LysR family regulator
LITVRISLTYVNLGLVGLDHLKLFRDIATNRSVSRGAALSGISQSAASQHLQELERELGVQLLDRSTRPLALTEAGRLYLDFCRDVLRRKAQFDAMLGELKDETHGTVRVASIYSVGLSEMSRLEEEFGRRKPGVKLEVEYLRPERVYEALLSGQADFGLVSYPEATKEITVISWRQEEMALACGTGHPLAARTRPISPQELDGADFVGFDEDLPIRRDVDRFLREHGVHVRMVMHFDNLEMVKEAVALGSGVSIVPARVLHADVELGRIKVVALEAPGLYRPLGILHQRRKILPPVAQAFLQLLQESPQPEPAPA